MGEADDPPGGGNISEKLKSPQWRAIIVALLVFIILVVWTQYFTTSGPARYEINYSQFLGQLDAGNIKSVSIRKLQVNGEFIKEINISLPETKKPVTVKYFLAYLPSFQGEALLSELKNKKVT